MARGGPGSTEVLLRTRIRGTGLWLGIAVYAGFCVLLFVLRNSLARLIDADFLDMGLAVIGFVAPFVIVPFVKGWYETRAFRLYCAQHGHTFEELLGRPGQSAVMCKRCGHLKMAA
jgi:hypothetical protein